MKKFLVKYFLYPKDEEIIFECADLETCKKAVAQWKVNEKRLKGNKIYIDSIEEKE